MGRRKSESSTGIPVCGRGWERDGGVRPLRPFPSRPRGSAPDPAPQSPDGLQAARPAIEDEAHGAGGVPGAQPPVRRVRAPAPGST
ncbi:hypothetical protein SAM9427_24150 [Streptomyces sp. ETH9427]|nr:hypothetical protein SAM9427_24150 [Streptomyces sp. ETH9427]